MARSKVQITPNPNGPTALELVKRTFPGRMANDTELLAFFQNLANLAAAGAEGQSYSGVKLRQTGPNVNVFAGGVFNVQWNVQEWDTSNFWEPAAPFDIVIPESGRYEIIASAMMFIGPPGSMGMCIMVNGAEAMWDISYGGNNGLLTLTPRLTIDLAQGDVIRARITCYTDGTAVRTDTPHIGGYAPQVEVRRL